MELRGAGLGGAWPTQPEAAVLQPALFGVAVTKYERPSYWGPVFQPKMAVSWQGLGWVDPGGGPRGHPLWGTRYHGNSNPRFQAQGLEMSPTMAKYGSWVGRVFPLLMPGGLREMPTPHPYSCPLAKLPLVFQL